MSPLEGTALWVAWFLAGLGGVTLLYFLLVAILLIADRLRR